MLGLDADDARRCGSGAGADGPAVERGDSVVDQVYHDALDLVRIDSHGWQSALERALECDVLEQPVVEPQRVGQQRVEIDRHRPRRRQPREVRELVDQSLESLHLSDDGCRALIDEGPGLCRRARQVATDPLRAQLNRGERVLDLVRQAARNVAPRGYSLSPKQWRHIIKHHYDAIQLVLTWQARRRDGEMTLSTFPRQRHLLRRASQRPAAGLTQHRPERREVRPFEHRGGRLPDHRRVDVQQPGSRGVDRAETTYRVDRDHPGRDSLQDGLM